jgi:hypothetical protein
MRNDSMSGAPVYGRWVSFLAILCSLLTFGQGQTVGVYHNFLENAWQDWSWCTRDLGSTDYVFSGTTSVKVTYTGAWQGFFLASPTGFLADGLGSLTFEINGGKTSGRSISVAAYVNGASLTGVDLNKYLAGHVVPAKQWVSASIPLKDLGLKPGQVLEGFWLQESSGAAQPPFYLDEIGFTYLPPPANTVLRVQTNQVLRTIDPKLFGVNVAIWDQNLASPQCAALIQQAGYKCFRFPGGSASDGYHWATNTSDSNTWQWVTNFDTFASMSAFTQGQCFITANYGTGTPQEAAAWVQYSNVTKGYGYKYWEVGNECFGFWEEDAQARAHDPTIYAQRFSQYYQQMKAVDPTIQVGAVAVPGEDDFANYSDETATNPRTGVAHHGWTPVMLATLAKLGVHPDFLAYHRYPQSGVDCDYGLLTNNSGWSTDLSTLRQQLSDYLGSAGGQVQLMCTENNSDSGPNGKQSTSLVNGLYLADSFGSLTQSEANSYVWWDLINGEDTSGDVSPWLYGWRMYGDLGVVSPDFSQLYPTLFVEQLLTRFAAPGDQVVEASSDYPLLTTYATKRADGSLRVLVINKNPAAAASVSLALYGFIPQPAGTISSYGIPQDTAASLGQPQVIQTTASKNFKPVTKLSFAPYSVTVIEVKRAPLQVKRVGTH